MKSSEHTPSLRGPMSFEVLEHLRQRNEAKRQEALTYLGTHWILHPSHAAQKKTLYANLEPRTSR